MCTSFNDVRRDLDMLVRWGKIGENLTLLLRGDCEKDRSGGAWGWKSFMITVPIYSEGPFAAHPV